MPACAFNGCTQGTAHSDQALTFSCDAITTPAVQPDEYEKLGSYALCGLPDDTYTTRYVEVRGRGGGGGTVESVARAVRRHSVGSLDAHTLAAVLNPRWMCACGGCEGFVAAVQVDGTKAPFPVGGGGGERLPPTPASTNAAPCCVETRASLPLPRLRTSPPGPPQVDSMKTEYPVIIGGENFGCGSSREHAPVALGAAGATVVVAQSYARIFFRNCVST